MSLKEKMLAVVEEISGEYSSKLFLPGVQCLDVENESYIIYTVKNDVRPSLSRFSGSRLEIIFDVQRGFALNGHFLKFQGVHTKIGYLLKRLTLSLTKCNLYFSDDFEYLYAVDAASDLVVEFHFRVRNYYVGAISLKTKFGNEVQSSLVKSLEDKYLRFEDLTKYASKKQFDAVSKILDAVKRSRNAEI
jgi:hypothetical protein